MEERKRYIVPADLQAKILFCGMTVPELIILAVLIFIAVQLAFHGLKQVLLLPVSCAVLCMRIDGKTNILSSLIKDSRYFFSQQTYSLGGETHVKG